MPQILADFHMKALVLLEHEKHDPGWIQLLYNFFGIGVVLGIVSGGIDRCGGNRSLEGKRNY
jgi:hypothetical protein